MKDIPTHLIDHPYPLRSWNDPTTCRKCSGGGINKIAWAFAQKKHRCSLCRGTGIALLKEPVNEH